MNNNKELENEASYFAMCILMAAFLVKREVEKMDIDLTKDDAIKTLAKKFDVSISAMAVRFSQLNIFKL